MNCSRTIDAIKSRRHAGESIESLAHDYGLSNREIANIIGNTQVRFTQTESKVLEHLAKGLTNAEIAEAMGVSKRTTESHVARMLSKAGCKNRTALVVWWASQSA